MTTVTTMTVNVSATSRKPKPTLPRFSVAVDAAGARAVDRALAQLLAPATLERRLLFECDLELSMLWRILRSVLSRWPRRG